MPQLSDVSSDLGVDLIHRPVGVDLADLAHLGVVRNHGQALLKEDLEPLQGVTQEGQQFDG